MNRQNESTKKVTRSCHALRISRLSVGVLVASQLLVLPHSAQSFQTPTSSMQHQRSLQLQAADGHPENDIAKQLERAKALIAKAKQKMETKEQQEEEPTSGNVPFFASKDASQSNKKGKVIKTTNEEGLFTTDGDLMAEMSEGEEWEVRKLLDLFEDQSSNASEEGTKTIADRDVAASIYNLRKVLQTEDYMKIFDKRNRFIGDY
jgi:hypothetical protein